MLSDLLVYQANQGSLKYVSKCATNATIVKIAKPLM
jgi:hypothetical protein